MISTNECKPAEQCADVSGLVFDIQRFSIHDGPGIRTTVFLKGCPLGCLWCHNPESRSKHPQLAFYASKCMGCGRCAKACLNGGILPGDDRVDRVVCKVCGACAEACPTGALQFIGKDMSVAQAFDVVVRDEPFYKTSGGGVTISGGEPTYQLDFTVCLLQACKDRGMHTAIETCGLAPRASYLQLIDVCDMFLFDVKALDPSKHAKFCRADNELILDNARFLAESGQSIIYRAPLVPGLNDQMDDLRLLGEFILSLPGKQKLELMAYHRIGTGKYEALGMQYTLDHVEAADLVEPKRVLTEMGVELVGE